MLLVRPKLIYSRSGYQFAVTAIFLRLLLDFVYLDFISVQFGYMGFQNKFSASLYVESWVAFGLLLLVAPKRFTRPSDFFVSYLIMMTALPIIVLYPFMKAPSSMLWTFIVPTFSICIFRLPKPIYIKGIKSGRSIFIVVASFLIAIVTIQLITNVGLKNFNLDFLRVYEIRDHVQIIGGSVLMSYLTTWMTKVFGPVLMAIFLLNRRYDIVIVIALMHVLWFGILQHKSIIFYPALIFLTFKFLKKEVSLSFLPITLLAVTIFCYATYYFFDDIIMLSMLVRRSLFTPALLTFDYFEFFSTNPHVYWSNSLLSGLSTYTYDASITKIISEYRGGTGGANNHFLASGYMQAGIFGLFIYTTIIIIILNIFDSFRRSGIPQWFVVSVGAIPMHALITSADLPVAVVTHGLGLSMLALMLVCYRRETIKAIN